METMNYFHLFANGDDARGFILDVEDFYAAFNRFGVCAAATGVAVLSFSIEDSHPHALLYGLESECVKFKELYETTTLHYIVSNRGSAGGVVFYLELYPIADEDYLRNVAAYTIVQPTKDGKRVMPYDYLWGTGSMYFRPENHIPIWSVKADGSLSQTRRMSGSKSRYCDPNGKSPVTGWYAMAFFFHPIMWISAILRRFIKHTTVSGIIAPPGKSGMPRLLPRWQIAGVSCWRIWKPERFVPKPSGHNLVSGMSGL